MTSDGAIPYKHGETSERKRSAVESPNEVSNIAPLACPIYRCPNFSARDFEARRKSFRLNPPLEVKSKPSGLCRPRQHLAVLDPPSIPWALWLRMKEAMMDLAVSASDKASKASR